MNSKEVAKRWRKLLAEWSNKPMTVEWCDLQMLFSELITALEAEERGVEKAG